ncbi:MAG: sodium:proton antiporter [Clostridiales Family XIII bacterium]|jgi:CPA1 family monovalent cation:H+ antiporter|nr:sodium:proton antiporter [Clostridiales Family XIII bacterium]
MELTKFIMILVVAIVVSNLMDSAYPKFPLPLAQIGFGVIIALTPFYTKITINPELFMGLLIAPLLFHESEETDILALWRIRKTVIFMVFGLVFVTVFVIGFAVHSLVPAIPLAACFCLGAALGPTDAIAVSTVSSRIEISDKIMNILKGEFLINDASGVISFNFAALALVTGSFSLFEAGGEFLLLCGGGFAIGMIVASIKSSALKTLKSASIRNSAAFMLIEILTPFICFFVAEGIGFSGIIAAVTAGCRQALAVRKIEKFEADFSTLKKSVWNMITVVFNSFIFLLLGLSLPAMIKTVVEVDYYTIGFAVGVGLFATGVLFAVRFLGVALGARDLKEKNPKEKLRGWIILTLSGVKGTVSLATAFSLPFTLAGGAAFLHRDFLFLVTACAIVFSLAISTVLLPIIAKPKRSHHKNNIYINIIRDVIPTIETSGSACAAAVAIHLKRRVRQLEYDDLTTDQKKRVGAIKKDFSEREFHLLEQQRRAGEITEAEYADYFKISSLIAAMQDASPARRYFNRLRFTLRLIGGPKEKGRTSGADVHRIHVLFWTNTGHIGEILEHTYGRMDDEILSRIIEERIDIATDVMERYYGRLLDVKLTEEYDRELKRCFRLERQKLNEYLEAGRVTEDEADEVRIVINTLETYAIRDVQSDTVAKLFMKGQRQRASKRKKSR